MESFQKFYLKESPFLNQLNSTWDEYSWDPELEHFKRLIFQQAKEAAGSLTYDPKHYFLIPIAKEIVKTVNTQVGEYLSYAKSEGYSKEEIKDTLPAQIYDIIKSLKYQYGENKDYVKAFSLMSQALDKYKDGKHAEGPEYDFIKNYNPQTGDAAEVISYIFDHQKLLRAFVDTGEHRDTTKQNLVAQDDNFKVYKVSTNEQAMAPCWKNKDGGDRFCVTDDPQQYVNMYGGYPFYVFTRKTEGRKKLYGVLMPNAFAKYGINQGIRNASNTGPMKPEEVRAIYPLIQKVDAPSAEILKGVVE